jgi:hypothetical protein
MGNYSEMSQNRNFFTAPSVPTLAVSVCGLHTYSDVNPQCSIFQRVRAQTWSLDFPGILQSLPLFWYIRVLMRYSSDPIRDGESSPQKHSRVLKYTMLTEFLFVERHSISLEGTKFTVLRFRTFSLVQFPPFCSSAIMARGEGLLHRCKLLQWGVGREEGESINASSQELSPFLLWPGDNEHLVIHPNAAHSSPVLPFNPFLIASTIVSGAENLRSFAAYNILLSPLSR